MQVRFLLAAPCFQAMTCSTSWPSPLSFKQKITGSNPVHVTTRRDLSKVGTMFLTHEIGVQFSVAAPGSPWSSAYRHPFPKRDHAGWIPAGLTIVPVLRVSSNGFKALPSEG
jgi:hypothetical protein